MRKHFQHTKIHQKCSRIMAALLLLTMSFAYCSGITAFAAVDLDVTIIPPADTVQNGKYCDVQLQMVTKSTNGYVELVIDIEYDADLLALTAPVNDAGYKVTGSKGQLRLTYFDPTGTNTPTPIGNDKTILIRFTVLENAPDTKTKIKAKIDHAYNSRGKNVTWTPIYDKEIEIIRINEGVSSDTVSSEEESSQFVVGTNLGTVNRASGSAGAGGKVASVIIGALVVFAAGMATGYIVCMRRYESGGISTAPSKSDTRERRRQEYRDRPAPPDDEFEYQSRSAKKRASVEDYSDYDNDDDFYTKPQGDSFTVTKDDYFTSITPDSGTGGNYLDAFAASPMGSRSISAEDFNNIIDGKAKIGMPSDDDDDYPILFMTRDSGGSSGRAKGASVASPAFDEDEDTIFGKFTDNVERDDDGYGGISSGRRRDRDRSERSRRNR